jgi:ubiquinone/menaquinone biosynthesis C-methylase UbiE
MSPTQHPAHPPNAAETYEQIYVPAIFGPLARLVLRHAAPRPGERVLDLACGTGIVARSVAPLVGASGRVTALDLRPGMLAAGRARAAAEGAAIEWLEGDALAPDLPDAAFDLVVCQQGLQFFADRAAGLRQVHRVLGEAGRVTLAVWRSVDAHPIFAEFAAAEVRHLGSLGVTREDALAPFSLGKSEELRDLLERAGFRNIEIVEETVDVRFPSAKTFVRDMEYPYSAFMPQFSKDPAAFTAFIEGVERETRDIVERHRDGEGVRFPMHTHVTTAHK